MAVLDPPAVAQPDEAATKLEPVKKSDNGVTKEYIIKEVLLGTTIGFAQIPESVAFAFLANVSPPIALHAAWMVGLICSLFGGRPGMVNGATGAFAAIIGTFLAEPKINGGNGEGIETLFPSVMIAGALMLLVSFLNMSKFIILLPAPVMVGFCNGLAFVIGLAQLHPFEDSTTHEFKTGEELLWMVVIMMSAMLIMEFFPKIPFKVFKIIPSSLLGIIAAVAIEFLIVRPLGSRTDTIGDVNEFSFETAFPIPFFINERHHNYDFASLGMKDVGTIIKQGVLLCVVGTIESLMTSEVVESFVNTPSDGNRTVLAMGVGNMLSGFMGGMGGNAMIGLSTINVLNGGTGRISPTCTALLVAISVMGAYPLLNIVPVAALAGIMIVVVLHTFKWWSLQSAIGYTLRKAWPSKDKPAWIPTCEVPGAELAVIVIVTLLSIFMNIAYAVLVGASACGLIYAWTSTQEFEVTTTFEADTKIYDVAGPIYFATANKLLKSLDVRNDPDSVLVRYTYSAVNDFTVKDTCAKITNSYKAQGKSITFAPSGSKVESAAIAKITDVEKQVVDGPAAAEAKVDPVAPQPSPEKGLCSL